jgi:hypothetical protein
VSSSRRVRGARLPLVGALCHGSGDRSPRRSPWVAGRGSKDMTIRSRTAKSLTGRGVGLGLASLLVALAAVGCSGSSTTPSSTAQARSTATVVPSETPSGTPTLPAQAATPTPTPVETTATPTLSFDRNQLRTDITSGAAKKEYPAITTAQLKTAWATFAETDPDFVNAWGKTFEQCTNPDKTDPGWMAVQTAPCGNLANRLASRVEITGGQTTLTFLDQFIGWALGSQGPISWTGEAGLRDFARALQP